MILKIGLTGGIGSGKSTVSQLFEALGVPIIDADVIARDLVKPGTAALRDIASGFGDAMLDNNGNLHRAKLRELIFRSPAKRAQLEAILHPRIRQQMLALAAHYQGQYPYCIFSIPLLVEGHWQAIVDRIVVVDVTEQQQLERTCLRDQVDEQAARSILASQVSRHQRLRAAHDVIDNTGDQTCLAQQVAALHQRYLKLSDSE